jgi:hypothetical protein
MFTYRIEARAGRHVSTLGPYVAQSPLGALLQAGRELAAKGRASVTELRAQVTGPAPVRQRPARSSAIAGDHPGNAARAAARSTQAPRTVRR